MSRSATHATELIGRAREMRALFERIAAAKDAGGGALLVRGAAGIGKTSLLAAARAHAAGQGFQILATTGIQSESELPFSGLHPLLRPVLRDMERLPEAYDIALQTAFGMTDGSSPSSFQIALATLHLLSESAESAPILLMVDDAQWLDRSTADALAFIARRLESDPIVLIAVVRDGFEGPLLEIRLPELRIERLVEADAATLLDDRAPGLSAGVRNRILSDAAGNPLALVELPVALAARDAYVVRSTDLLPLTDRLEQAFAGRISSLGSAARSLLQVAATNETGVLDELLSAASHLEGHDIALEAANEAVDAGLVEIEGYQLRFRHPLMRSAIHQTMSPRERQAAHAALAAACERDLDRRAWHRAAAALGSSEEIAADLEAAAERATKRGAKEVAFAALERAAEFTDHPERRGTRLIHAAYFGTVIGRPSDVRRILDKIDDRELKPLDRPHVAWLREMFAQGSWSGATRIASFVEIADQSRAQGDVQAGLETLCNIALRCWWSNPDEETRRALVAVVERFPVPETNSNVLFILAMADPVECGAIVLDRLSRWAEPQTGAARGYLGGAAIGVGDLLRAERYFEAHILDCRSHGWLGSLAKALVWQAWTKIPRGDWKNARTMASEAARLAEETGQGSFWMVAADLAAATVAAYRGEIAVAERLAAAGEQVLLPRGANPLLALVQWPRGAAALAGGRYDEAYQHLRRIFVPSDSAHHPHVRSWALVDLVEASVHSGHEREAAGFANELETIAAKTHSPILEGALQFARPVLSQDGNEAAFQPGAELAHWPLTRARLQLAHGLWLRRQRRAADARTPLRAARDAFDALGATPWAERAQRELRASGETSRRRTWDLSDALSPQEHQIAQLAAAGLSNKEIGQQLFLSHRTIESHLYRIFPKLGITARSRLNAALQDRAAQSTT
jgi:DNA-binding CsgD family transcriptional regulator